MSAEDAEIAPVEDGPVAEGPPLTPADQARFAADALDRTASLAVIGIAAVGFYRAAGAILASGDSSHLMSGLLNVVAGLALAWLLGTLIRGFASLIRLQAEHADAFGRAEQRMAEGLERLGAGLAEARQIASTTDPKTQIYMDLRHAIRMADWADAETNLGLLRDRYPDDPQLARAEADLLRARNEAAQELLGKLEAAREVNDPERVIELRDKLKPLLASDALKTMDRDLARWFLALIQKRLRAGTVRPDVAVLAGKVAESLDDTPEGASLRASLPTLRRAAGLCAKCAQPYTGIENACPNCLNGPGLVTVPFPQLASVETEESPPGD